ncbi:MAG: PqqD family peptide modification chaperone [Proteobacteria bacterium]|nr:PqqD family peptide modification chaperone [Pseudomonadota bacterium]MBU1456037.1 PqqD family peptide modification chaperone [Pseudomonadota bacterium]
MTNIDMLSLDNDILDSLLLCREKENISTELEGETVILDMASGIYSGLDAVGTSIWNLLEQPTTFSALCQKIMEEYDVTEDACRTDLLSFLKELADNKLISIRHETAA